MSPVFAHGSLRLYLLHLLSEESRHGYDLIQAFGERFGGTYTPSAGTIYPRLAKLEEEGLVTRVADGRKTVYAITEAGRAELVARADDLAAVEEEVSSSVRSLASQVRRGVDDAMRSLKAELAAAARDSRETVQGRDAAEERADKHEQVAARIALQQAEAHLSAFRAEARAALRQAVQFGRLDEAAVSEFRSGLDSVQRALEDRLR